MVAYACEGASVRWARAATSERTLFDYVTPPEPPEPATFCRLVFDPPFLNPRCCPFEAIPLAVTLPCSLHPKPHGQRLADGPLPFGRRCCPSQTVPRSGPRWRFGRICAVYRIARVSFRTSSVVFCFRLATLHFTSSPFCFRLHHRVLQHHTPPPSPLRSVSRTLRRFSKISAFGHRPFSSHMTPRGLSPTVSL